MCSRSPVIESGPAYPVFWRNPNPRSGTPTRWWRWSDSGAAVRGIAHTDEFAYSLVGRNTHYGTPPNAAVPGAVPGGSSSGPAAAVGLGLADIGLGTDTAGSIRIPASYQGLWGLRTSHARVSTSGMVPLAPSFDTVGLPARSSHTLAVSAAALLGTSADSSLAGVELVVNHDLLALLTDGVRALFRTGLQRLSRVADRPLGLVRLGDPAVRAEAVRIVQAAEAWQQHGRWLQAHPVRRATLKLTSIAGAGGYPVVSVPNLVMTTLHASAPVGLCLVGPRGSDLALIELACQIENALV